MLLDQLARGSWQPLAACHLVQMTKHPIIFRLSATQLCCEVCLFDFSQSYVLAILNAREANP
jgi:hypothetical protein